MPTFEHNQTRIEYAEFGDGFPVLLLAPGGMRSSSAVWERAPWHPIRELRNDFRLIAMDQRNAGASHAPVSAADGWQTYCEDQLRLLDHLAIERCHLLGGCIGCSFALRLIQAAPGRVSSAVLQQPIGHSPENRETFYELFEGWANDLRSAQPQMSAEAWRAFRERMYGGDFVFSVSREFLGQLETPLLVLMGNDIYHPSAISREIVALAPNAELVERWKEPDAVDSAVGRVRRFLRDQTPHDD